MIEVSEMTVTDGTSAHGAMRAARPPQLVVVSLIAGLGATASHADPSPLELEARRAEAVTSAGVPLAVTPATGTAIGEVRRLSGLTWDQLSRLFQVSRRALHFWASGRPMNAAHEERLHRTLAALRAFDRGSASANRTLLLSATENGVSPFDMLAAGRFDDLRALVEPGGVTRPKLGPLSEEARRARMPLAPEVLADALQDDAAPQTGRVLKSWPIQPPRRS